jgi:hypothetical protein
VPRSTKRLPPGADRPHPPTTSMTMQVMGIRHVRMFMLP